MQKLRDNPNIDKIYADYEDEHDDADKEEEQNK